MIVSGAAKPSSKVLSLVCFSISFFNYSTKEEEEEKMKSSMTDVLAVSRRNDLNLNCA